MRRLGLLLVLGALLAVWSLVSGAAPSNAVECKKRDPVTGICIIVVTPAPSNPTTSPGGGGGGPGGGAQECVNSTWGSRGTIACTQTAPRFGVKTYWSNDRQCYIGLETPQPPPNDPAWQGHYGEGAVYFCAPPTLVRGGNVVIFFWSLTPPAGPAAPPDPRVLAQQAVATMRLKAIMIGIVPENRPGRVGIVGMPSWMWVQRPSQSTWGPITRSASAGGYTVTATARVERVVWAMGDGSMVTCIGPGTAYEDSFGKKSSPTCGHTFTRQGAYTVRARSYWRVQWAGVGQSGTILIDFTQTTNITMGEAQVLGQ